MQLAAERFYIDPDYAVTLPPAWKRISECTFMWMKPV
ncbi:hypothetical protein ECP03018678_5251, partial [Escherichia coli P0301867.8]